MAGPPFYVGDARGYPHGEIFCTRGEPGKWQVLVYSTIGLSRCPPRAIRCGRRRRAVR